MTTRTINDTARHLVIVRHSVGVLEQWAYRSKADAKGMQARMAEVRGVVSTELAYVRNYRGRRYTRVVL